MNAKCDLCEAEFDLQVQTRREGDIEVAFFCCPQCEREYAICRTNPELRKLQQKVEQHRARIGKQRAAGRLNAKYLARLEELTKELKAKMNQFNEKES